MRCEVSAVSGEGIDDLLDIISKHIKPEPIITVVQIQLHQSRERALIYSHSNVLDECFADKNTLELTVEIDKRKLEQLKKSINIQLIEGKLANGQRKNKGV